MLTPSQFATAASESGGAFRPEGARLVGEAERRPGGRAVRSRCMRLSARRKSGSCVSARVKTRFLFVYTHQPLRPAGRHPFLEGAKECIYVRICFWH